MSIYQDLGVRPFINAGGWTYTRYGGSIMPLEVLSAMTEASRHFVNLFDLQNAVGKRIADMTRNEAAFVSCGAASGILLAVASCIAGTDEALANHLPDSAGMRNEVVMPQRDRGTEADSAIRAAGGRIVNIGNADGMSESQFLSRLNDHTAAVVLLARDQDDSLSVGRIVELAHARKIPVLVDGACAVPPQENLWRYTRDLGVDALITSGGKAIRGPQSTGLVLGSRAMIEGCKFHSSPNCRIGRGMKVGKEEFVGIYTALSLFMTVDHATNVSAQTKQIAHIAACLKGLPGLMLNIVGDGTQVEIEFDPAVIPITAKDFEAAMLAGAPSILLLCRGNRITVRAWQLQAGEELLVGQSLRTAFIEHTGGE
jgi:L-seryl-tRNA(Ser) seleniumtransferase